MLRHEDNEEDEASRVKEVKDKPWDGEEECGCSNSPTTDSHVDYGKDKGGHHGTGCKLKDSDPRQDLLDDSQDEDGDKDGNDDCSDSSNNSLGLFIVRVVGRYFLKFTKSNSSKYRSNQVYKTSNGIQGKKNHVEDSNYGKDGSVWDVLWFCHIEKRLQVDV